MVKTRAKDEMAMTVLERRASLRARILAEERREADARAAATGSSLRCRSRRAVYGLRHEPCEPPADDQLGLVCLCPCHDEALGDSGA